MIECCRSVLLHVCVVVLGLIAIGSCAVFVGRRIEMMSDRLRRCGRINVLFSILALGLLVAYGGSKPTPQPPTPPTPPPSPAEPEIQNVTARQRHPWNGKVDVSFEVVGDVEAVAPEGAAPALSLSATDRVTGATYAATASALSGDTGTEAGSHNVVWDLNAQGIELASDDVVLSVAYVAQGPLCAAEESAPLSVDSRTGIDPLIASIAVTWNASWIGGDGKATVVIEDNGSEVRRATGAGEFTYAPSRIGRHELTYTTYIGGVAQPEVYSATVYANWKYEVREGGVVITETTQTSGAVVIPSEIDGLPVTGIDGVFAGCGGLKSVTIPDSVTSLGERLFAQCGNLAAASLPASLKDAVEKGHVFEGCSDSLVITYRDDDTSGGIAGYFDTNYSSRQELSGVLFDANGNVAGSMTLKAAKKNKKNKVKISATATLLNGKKANARALTIDVGGGAVSGALAFNGLGGMTLDIGEDGAVSLGNDVYFMSDAKAGGSLPNVEMKFSVDIASFPALDAGYELVEEAMPLDLVAKVSGGKKLDFGKAAAIKYKKVDNRFVLDGLADAKKPNLSAMKLTYAPKTGIFKGSFKVYATNEGSVAAGKKPTLKKFTVNVTGFFVDRGDGLIGIGQATMKKPAASWAVTIE